MLAWQRIWVTLLGWEPPFHQLHPIVAAYVIYISCFVICQILYRSSRLFLPGILKEYAEDFFKTMAFCCYPFGHMMMRRFYGEPGFYVSMVPITTATELLFPSGAGNPCAVWAGLLRGVDPAWKFFVRVVVQICAGQAAYRLGMELFTLELHPLYDVKLNQEYCTSFLNVPAIYGFLLEMAGLTWVTLFNMRVISKNKVLDTLVKFANIGILVMIGVRKTGMFMHPAMASGHSFGCRPTHPLEHILVYWAGPFTGVLLATMICKRFTAGKKTIKDDTARVSPKDKDESKAKNERIRRRYFKKD